MASSINTTPISVSNQEQAAILKVAVTSRSAAVAGAIAGKIREFRFAEVQAIGAGAVNQAVKAIVIAIKYLQEDSIAIRCVPQFVNLDIDGEERTAVRFTIETRPDDNKEQ